MTPLKRSSSALPDITDPSVHKKLLSDEAADDSCTIPISDEDDNQVGSFTDGKENKDGQSENYLNNINGVNLTSQDIQIARETAELFQSNIFKLQIDELVQQVKLKDSYIFKIEHFLHKLYDIIQEIPDWEDKTLEDVEIFFKTKEISIPFVDPKPLISTTNYKFGYKAPSISLIGSFALKTTIFQPQGSSIDVLLTMPKDLFDKKDFLNFRCIHKRSVFLAYFTYRLSLYLSNHGLDDFLQLNYMFLNNDPLQPILNISSKKQTDSDYNFFKSRFSINLILGFSFELFDPKKLLPNKNCIRIGQDNSTPTPFYNFSILSSASYEHYLKYIYKTKKQTESFKEACILGKIWLSQRGFKSDTSYSGSLSGFGHFEFSTLMAALLNGGGVNGNKILLHGFSSYQLFKGTIKYLATMDLCSDGHLQFYSDTRSTTNLSTSRYVEQGFQTPTIFDKTTKLNILSKISMNNYQILKLYCQETLIMLNDTVKDHFQNIFLTNLGKVEGIKYDHSFDLNLSSAYGTLLSTFGPLEKIKFISFENFIINKISNIVKISLGDRIKGFELELSDHKTLFPITKRKPNNINFSSVKIKLIINPLESEKLVTKGPHNSNNQDDSVEIVQFKNFWGNKASLRRFRDGSIVHCCVWTTSSLEPVVLSILNYTFQKHIFQDIKLSDQASKQFCELLPLPNLPGSSKNSILNLSSYYNFKKSFDELYKVMFSIKLPLSIKSILPTGTAFRYTSLCQPIPFSYSNPDFLQDVIIEFETSSKWPDEISSLEKSKASFLLKIQEYISHNYQSRYKTFFTRDESIPYNLDIITLNVLTSDGFGFRFRVSTERDEIMYLRAIKNVRSEFKPELEKCFLKFISTYQVSIRHTRVIESISHDYQFYSPVVRLFKKWLDCHLLLGHLPDELIELIAIKPFVDSAPFFIPGSVENGFLKILNFLSGWNWREEPLILDLVKSEDFSELGEANIDTSQFNTNTLKHLSEKLTLQQYKVIQSNFQNLRSNDPEGFNIQFFIASKNDPSGILYSSGIPLPIATRLTALSKVAINLIQAHGLNKETIDLLFTPALKDYDFVVHIKSPISFKVSSGVLDQTQFKNLASVEHEFSKDISQLSDKMDPTYQLVKYLNMKYKNSLIFSSHRYMCVNGGIKGDENVITGLIKPAFKNPLKFKVNMDCNIIPIDKDTVKLNKEAIFREILAFGRDLVTGFDVN